MAARIPEMLLAQAMASSPRVSAIVQDRIYPVIAPSSAAVPLIAWRRLSVVREQALTGPVGMPVVTLSVELIAETYETVRELADACRETLDGWGGDLGNLISVRLVSLLNESDGFAQLAGGDLPPVYSVTQTYTILWQET